MQLGIGFLEENVSHKEEVMKVQRNLLLLEFNSEYKAGNSNLQEI